mmetsp:Transcript_32720/g.79595  ORF Transcript_32720/g.79595 Transcript_32720/m.79595 type:complete len:315 (-) Transcript_32720:1127-2071(-)
MPDNPWNQGRLLQDDLRKRAQEPPGLDDVLQEGLQGPSLPLVEVQHLLERPCQQVGDDFGARGPRGVQLRAEEGEGVCVSPPPCRRAHRALHHPGRGEVRKVGVEPRERPAVEDVIREGLGDAVDRPRQVAEQRPEPAEGEGALHPGGVADARDPVPAVRVPDRRLRIAREDRVEQPVEPDLPRVDELLEGAAPEVEALVDRHLPGVLLEHPLEGRPALVDVHVREHVRGAVPRPRARGEGLPEQLDLRAGVRKHLCRLLSCLPLGQGRHLEGGREGVDQVPALPVRLRKLLRGGAGPDDEADAVRLRPAPRLA